jgi:Uma2 family endonuclease
MSSLPEIEAYFTPDQYLDLERESSVKHEYHAGHLNAMAGASEAHNLITINLGREVSTQLRGRPCRTYGSDMKVKIEEAGSYVYPDLTIVCGERRFDDEEKDALLNPMVVIEVLSPSTELNDRGRKFAYYRQLESITDYLMIAQDKPFIEHYTKQEEGRWVLAVKDNLQQAVNLESVQCRLALSDIYENVEFPVAEEQH